MKKLYTLALGAIVGVGSMAQVPLNQNAPMHKTQKATQQEVDRSNNHHAQGAQHQRGDVLFYEDFANGFDGNNAFGAWSTFDSGVEEMDVWMVADENSPAGEFSTNIGPLDSETADNGWVIFDADFYNTPVADGVEDLTGFLTTPELDLSLANSVIISYDQYFRYCCFSTSPLTVEVSNDGGNSWAVFPAHGTFIQNANQASANPLSTEVDITCAAAGESSVLIRFAYNGAGDTGYSHYYWGIDDVRLFENESENDIRMTQITNGDIFNIYEYRVTPLDQAIPEADGGLVAGAIYTNDGFADQTGVVITTEIFELEDTSSPIYTYSTEEFDLPSFANAAMCPNPLQDTLYMSTGWEPESAGDYLLRITINQNEVDETPDNNTMEKVIQYTVDPGLYGHDYVPLLDDETAPRESENDPELWEPDGWGNAYTFVNDDAVVWGASIRFGETTDPGAFYQVQLLNFDPLEGVNGTSTTVVAQTDGEVEEGWIPSGLATSTPTWLLFENENDDVFEGEFYYLGVFNLSESAEALTFYGMANSDNDFSSGSIDQSGAGDFIWFLSRTFTPAIRLITDDFVSVDEISTQNGFHMGQNVPNPAEATTRIPFSLDNASDVRFEIYDISGKLVKSIDKGQMAAGNQYIEIDISSLNAGIYSYSMIVNDQFASTKKMVVQ